MAKKVSAVSNQKAIARAVERLRMIGVFEFITFFLREDGDTVCLEWWGDEAEAEPVARAVLTATRQDSQARGELTVGPIDAILKLAD